MKCMDGGQLDGAFLSVQVSRSALSGHRLQRLTIGRSLNILCLRRDQLHLRRPLDRAASPRDHDLVHARARLRSEIGAGHDLSPARGLARPHDATEAPTPVAGPPAGRAVLPADTAALALVAPVVPVGPACTLREVDEGALAVDLVVHPEDMVVEDRPAEVDSEGDTAAVQAVQEGGTAGTPVQAPAAGTTATASAGPDGADPLAADTAEEADPSVDDALLDRGRGPPCPREGRATVRDLDADRRLTVRVPCPARAPGRLTPRESVHPRDPSLVLAPGRARRTAPDRGPSVLARVAVRARGGTARRAGAHRPEREARASKASACAVSPEAGAGVRGIKQHDAAGWPSPIKRHYALYTCSMDSCLHPRSVISLLGMSSGTVEERVGGVCCVAFPSKRVKSDLHVRVDVVNQSLCASSATGVPSTASGLTFGYIVELWADVSQHKHRHVVAVEVVPEGVHDMHLLSVSALA